MSEELRELYSKVNRDQRLPVIVIILAILLFSTVVVWGTLYLVINPADPNHPHNSAALKEVSGKVTSVPGKIILGEAELVEIEGIGSPLPARIDTGATISSLDAHGVQVIETGDKKSVRFTVHYNGQSWEYEAPYSGLNAVRQANTQDYVYRPMVNLQIKLGELSEVVSFALQDREHMSYPVLIGRDILRGKAVVDPELIYSLGQPEGFPFSASSGELQSQ